ncbi:MAG: GTP 3',8-cyclase MoaA [Verrucomicrobiia bacterium]
MISRIVNYLRISITDRCNERCLYCMPEGFTDWKKREDILTYEEILRVVRLITHLGFKNFRITGGEPLIRKDAVSFIEKLNQIPGVENVFLSTNATRLAQHASALKKAGVKSLNISLDSLQPETYQKITGGNLSEVLKGIQSAREAGFERIKLNTVLIRHMNEDDLWPLIHYAAEHRHPIRFIELMPISLTEMLSEKNFFPANEALKKITEKDHLIPLDTNLGVGPAKYYRLEKTGTIVGFISSITNLHFCENCNKIRLTADGKIRPCLGNHGEYDLKPLLRNGGADNDILEMIRLALPKNRPNTFFATTTSLIESCQPLADNCHAKQLETINLDWIQLEYFIFFVPRYSAIQSSYLKTTNRINRFSPRQSSWHYDTTCWTKSGSEIKKPRLAHRAKWHS